MTGGEAEAVVAPATERVAERVVASPGAAPGFGGGGRGGGNGTLARAAAAAGRMPPPRGRGLRPEGALLGGLRSLARRQLLRTPIETDRGSFDVEVKAFDPTGGKDSAKRAGVDVDASFHPPTGIKTTKIGFVQFMRFRIDGENYLMANEKPRATDGSGPDGGWVVDRGAGNKWGYYGMDDDGGSSADRVRFGSRTDGTTATDASMLDRVRIARKPGQRHDCTARTFAIDIDNGEYLGGFAWGYTLSKDGKITVDDVKPAVMGDAQRNAIKSWNAQADLADDKQKNSASQQKLPLAHQALGDYNSAPSGGNSATA